MISYATIDHFEGEYVVLEVEMHEIAESKTLSAREKETRIIDVKSDVFPSKTKIFPYTKMEFYEGDVILVEHDCEYVSKILKKDNAEKKRRIKRIRKLKEQLKLNS